MGDILKDKALKEENRLIELANAAEDILNNPAVQQFFSNTSMELYEKFLNVEPGKEYLLTDVKHSQQALRGIIEYMHILVMRRDQRLHKSEEEISDYREEMDKYRNKVLNLSAL